MNALLAWVKRWLGRTFAVYLCVMSWLIAAGLVSFGQGWFYNTVEIRGIEELILNGIVYATGPQTAAVFFFLLGPVILWAFWTRDP